MRHSKFAAGICLFGTVARLFFETANVIFDIAFAHPFLL